MATNDEDPGVRRLPLVLGLALALALALALVSCTSAVPQMTSVANSGTPQPDVDRCCAPCRERAGRDPRGMDIRVRPCTDYHIEECAPFPDLLIGACLK